MIRLKCTRFKREEMLEIFFLVTCIALGPVSRKLNYMKEMDLFGL